MATASPYIKDATADNFGSLVLQNSEQGPVLVNYWSPFARDCMTLMPSLLRLTEEFAGRFQLVRLNTDEFGELARHHGVRSLPTVTMYRHGRAVDTLRGAESEPVLRDFIRRHIARPAAPRQNSADPYQDGEMEQAVSRAAQAIMANPRDPQLPINLAKLLMLGRRFKEADELLRCLPAPAKDNPELRSIAAHLGFIRVSQAAPPLGTLEDAVRIDPTDLDSRYQLAAKKVVRNDYDGAIMHLMEIARRDPAFRDGAGRNGVLAIFAMLGDDDERVTRYRPLLKEPH